MAQNTPFSDDVLANAMQSSGMGVNTSLLDRSASSQARMDMGPPSGSVRTEGQPGTLHPLVHRRKQERQPLHNPRSMDPPQPLRSCICRLPAVVQQTQDDLILTQADESDIMTQVAQIFPFIDSDVKHGVFRESLNHATQGGPGGQPREWALYCARIASTRYDQVSVTSQPMNTPAGAYESLKNILRGLQPVRIGLGADDVWCYDDGCCSRCNLYQQGKHPSEHSQYKTKPTKRYQPGNR